MLPAMPHKAVDMFRACSNVARMSTMIQIRNVPDDLHRRLKARAAMAGMSLSDYLLKEIGEVAKRPTMEEMRERLASRSRVETGESAADAIRAIRGPLP
jgi:plasmid stability protein